MSSHRLRFCSPERDRETDERRFDRVRLVVRSVVADADAETKDFEHACGGAKVSVIPRRARIRSD
jgi:hypothetical protein